MEAATSLEDLREEWRHFLFEIDRVWNVAQAYYSRSPKWSGWHGPWRKVRERDELLSYLSQARNSHEHNGINDVERIAPFTVLGIEAEVGSTSTDHLGRPTVNLQISFKWDRVELLPVTNRNVTYAVPSSHKGTTLAKNDPISVAVLAVEHYEVFLQQAEAKFVKPVPGVAS